MATVAPLVVITGPTGSGKSDLALELAERYGGEIICADSRTIYRGMDIGTAKPTAADQARVPHHLLDVVEPGERFTVHDFQHHARVAIADIRARGRVPFLVGGTGLYIDSVVLDYEFPPEPDPAYRAELESLDVATLQERIRDAKLPLPENMLNKRHLLNTLLRKGKAVVRKTHPSENTLVVVITTDKAELERRIIRRAQHMFEAGVLREAQELGERYGWDSEAMTGNIYPILRRVLAGEMSRRVAIEQFVVRDRQLAKRQVTWTKRHDFVRWLTLPEAKHWLEAEIERRLRLTDVLG